MNSSSKGSMTNTSDIEQLDFVSHFKNENTTSNTKVFYLDIGNISSKSPSQEGIEKYVTFYQFAKPLSFPEDVSNQKFSVQVFKYRSVHGEPTQ